MQAKLILCLGLLTACDDDPAAERVKEKAGETVEAARELAAEKKKRAVADLEKKLEVIDGKIDQLRDEAKDAKHDTKKELDTKIAALEEKRDALKTRIADLSNKSSDAWDSAKDGVDSALSDLEKAYDEAKGKLSK